MAALTNEEILEAIASKTALELSELVKAIEEKFGVTAAVAVAAGPAAGGAVAEVEEQTEFTVTLESSDATKKIAVIKAVRAITGLGLADAKNLVEGAPKPIKEGISKEDAAKIKADVEAAGGVVKVS
jgi:large subunit ribosomal protein L7/L12